MSSRKSSKQLKLALGTVQFGLDYGVANTAGRVSFGEAREILRIAHQSGIDTLDTAIAYGDSESVLGRLGVDSWKVITKLPAVPDDCVNIEQWVRAQIHASMRRLNSSQLYGVLLHRPEQLLGRMGSEIYRALQQLKYNGVTSKIGLSIYNHQGLETILSRYSIDLVQAPINILDRRLIETGWADKLKQIGVELHARSAFLQGLLLMPATARPAKFNYWDDIWHEWERWLSIENLTPLEACLRYFNNCDCIDKVVVGVDSLNHVNQIMTAADGDLSSLPDFNALQDDRLINPEGWSKL